MKDGLCPEFQKFYISECVHACMFMEASFLVHTHVNVHTWALKCSAVCYAHPLNFKMFSMFYRTIRPLIDYHPPIDLESKE